MPFLWELVIKHVLTKQPNSLGMNSIGCARKELNHERGTLCIFGEGNKKASPENETRQYHEFAGYYRLWLPSLETVNFLRPRARRAANTRRPLGVDMRSRNPCLLRRLRLEGWKVRFISVSSCYKNRMAKISDFRNDTNEP